MQSEDTRFKSDTGHYIETLSKLFAPYCLRGRQLETTILISSSGNKSQMDLLRRNNHRNNDSLCFAVRKRKQISVCCNSTKYSNTWDSMLTAVERATKRQINLLQSKFAAGNQWDCLVLNTVSYQDFNAQQLIALTRSLKLAWEFSSSFCNLSLYSSSFPSCIPVPEDELTVLTLF